MKKNNSENGSLTVEATVFLTIFILFVLVVYDFLQIARAQVILQYAANQAAMEISEYSYVLTKAGITSKYQQTMSQSRAFQDDTANAVQNGLSVYNEIYEQFQYLSRTPAQDSRYKYSIMNYSIEYIHVLPLYILLFRFIYPCFSE